MTARTTDELKALNASTVRNRQGAFVISKGDIADLLDDHADSPHPIRILLPDGTEAAAATVAPPYGSTVSGDTLYLPGFFTIVESALADGDVTFAYSQTLTAAGGEAPYVWTLLGSLPAGLALNAATGTISGTPTTQQSCDFTAVCTDAHGVAVSQAYSVTIHSLSSKYQRMFAPNMIGWWKNSEPSGTTAHDSSALASDGTYSGVALNLPGCGDGGTCGVYDAASVSRTDVLTAARIAAFDGDEVTHLAWCALTDPATSWATSQTWCIFQDLSDGGSYFDALHSPNSATVQGRCSGSGPGLTGLSGKIGWWHIILTHSKTANAASMYIDGVANTATIGDTWSGALSGSKLGGSVANTNTLTFPGAQEHVIKLNRMVTRLEAYDACRIQESGVWTVHGVVIEPSALAQPYVGEPNLVKGAPVILTGAASVFKCYYSGGDNANPSRQGIYLAESLDCVHWVNHPSNPILPELTRCGGVVSLGGVYYMSAQTFANQIDIYSSVDGGVEWTLVAASVVPNDDTETLHWNSWLGYDPTLTHPWILLYDYPLTEGGYDYKIGLAQADSPAGPWVRSSNNPIVSRPHGMSTGTLGGAWAHKSADEHWHIWAHGGSSAIPTDGYRMDSAVLDAAFTDGPTSPTLPRYNPESAWSISNSQVADMSLLRDGDTTYMLYSVAAHQGEGIKIALATTPLTLDQLSKTREGIAPGAKHEWLINPSFESVKVTGTTFAFWTDTVSNGAIARTMTVGEVYPDTSRLAACKLTAGAAVDTRVAQQIDGMIPGRQYLLTGHGRGDGTHAGRIRVQSAASAELIPWGTSLTTTSATYAAFSFTFVAPKDGAATLSLYCPGTSGGIAYFDDLSLKLA